MRVTVSRMREQAERARDHLVQDPRVRLVYLFGSAARSAEGPSRDIDVAILTDPPLSLDELMRLRAQIVEGMGAPIDLVSLNHASIVLAWEVAETGLLLFAATPDAETEFVTRARAHYWDFKPYREEQWRLAGERLEERRRGS
jgi:predicted nucleotidyltransferase